MSGSFTPFCRHVVQALANHTCVQQEIFIVMIIFVQSDVKKHPSGYMFVSS